MSNWIKFDPADNKTWPENYQYVLMAIPSEFLKPLWGYMISYVSRVKVFACLCDRLIEIPSSKVISWQELPAMPEEEDVRN